MLLSYLFIVVFLTCVDQFSKLVVNTYIIQGEKIELIKDFFYLTYVRNTGAAWSMFEGKQMMFIVITVIAIIGFSYFLIKEKDSSLLTKASYLLIIGGAIGNLIDRILNSYVIDFLDFYIFGYDFPVFNVADMFLTIGVFLYIISFIVEQINAKN